MAVAFGAVVAFALAGTAASGAPRTPLVPARTAASAAPASAVPTSAPATRHRMTALDAARLSVPMPRATPATAAVTARPSTVRPSRSGERSRLAGEALWAALARCESSGNPSARSADGRYSGAFQFSDATWHSLGFEGRAADHPYSAQVEAAKRLQARSGWGQWPRCARRLGLR
jgi:hypothetical protein